MKAIVQATFQVLDREGAAALTTTRVAEVAGVSVGTLYQYFANREALIMGLLADHLAIAIDAVEAAAAEVRGAPLPDAIAHVIRAFVAVKVARAPVSRALRPALAGTDERPLVRTASARGARTIARLLAGDREPDLAAVRQAELVCAAIEGVIARIIDEDPARLAEPEFLRTLTALVHGGTAALADAPPPPRTA